MNYCNNCPRKCNKSRLDDSTVGFCGVKSEYKIARAGVHFFEEPCISGTRGSGTVFFSGCSLNCIYCQNKDISFNCKGKYVSEERLYDIFDELVEKNVHNINLVTPTHYSKELSKTINKHFPIPIVYNSSGYESIECLKLLSGKIQIYLADLKYSDNDLALKYSKTSDYFEIATKSIEEMYRQVGDYIIDREGIMQKGLIIRHLVLPDNLDNTYGIIDWVSKTFKNKKIKFSLMSQYTPISDLPFKELNRRISDDEYEKAVNYMYLCGLTDGYTQEISSSNEIYIPDFDLSGV